MFTDAQLAAALGCPWSRAAAWGPHLRQCMQRDGINTRNRAVHFIAEVGHESASLAKLEENLNYSANRLLEVFPLYFDAHSAAAHARNPKAIALRVYGARMGNRAGSDDGWDYRGRSPIGLTGRDNYAEMQRLTGLPLLASPQIATGIAEGAAISTAWWRANGLNALADQDDVLAVARRINLGTTRTRRMPNGYSDRVARTKRARLGLGA